MTAAKKIIFIPTYNEQDNILPLCKQDSRVSVIHRSGKLGVGSAHKEGIAWAYKHGYQHLLTMDADFTHSPEYIPELFSLLSQHDAVVGSRYLMSDSLKEWSWFRKVLTWTAHFLTTRLLNFPYDATGAFRAYRLDKISPEMFYSLKSDSYSFFFESLYKLHCAGYLIKEVPINLPARATGNSKMSSADAFKSLFFLFKMYKDKA